MKVVAECKGYLMIAEDETKEVDIDTECRVYNPELNVLAPKMKAGAWAVRIGPWEKPTKEYDVEKILAKAKKTE